LSGGGGYGGVALPRVVASSVAKVVAVVRAVAVEWWWQ
jgi:hypothetical protein